MRGLIIETKDCQREVGWCVVGVVFPSEPVSDAENLRSVQSLSSACVSTYKGGRGPSPNWPILNAVQDYLPKELTTSRRPWLPLNRPLTARCRLGLSVLRGFGAWYSLIT